MRPPDPTKVRWDMMAAFGSDEDGNSYLQAVMQHCCDPGPEDEALLDLVHRARQAYRDAGSYGKGRAAARGVLLQAGLVMLDDRTPTGGRGTRRAPLAVFYFPERGQAYILSRTWHLQAAEI